MIFIEKDLRHFSHCQMKILFLLMLDWSVDSWLKTEISAGKDADALTLTSFLCEIIEGNDWSLSTDAKMSDGTSRSKRNWTDRFEAAYGSGEYSSIKSNINGIDFPRSALFLRDLRWALSRMFEVWCWRRNFSRTMAYCCSLKQYLYINFKCNRSNQRCFGLKMISDRMHWVARSFQVKCKYFKTWNVYLKIWNFRVDNRSEVDRLRSKSNGTSSFFQHCPKRWSKREEIYRFSRLNASGKLCRKWNVSR